jgi:hypothetical protein
MKLKVKFNQRFSYAWSNTWRSLSAFMLTLLIASPSFAAKTEQPVSGYQFTLNSNRNTITHLYASDAGIRVEEQGGSPLVFVAHKPDWKIYALVNAQKSYCEYGLANLSGQPVVGEREVVQGLSLIHVTWWSRTTARQPVVSPFFSDFGKREKGGPSVLKTTFEIACADKLELPAAAAGAANSVRKFKANAPGLVVEFKVVDSKGRLDTCKIVNWKKTAIPTSQFAVPNGYKKLINVFELNRVAIRKDGETMADTLRIFDPLGTQK